MQISDEQLLSILESAKYHGYLSSDISKDQRLFLSRYLLNAIDILDILLLNDLDVDQIASRLKRDKNTIRTYMRCLQKLGKCTAIGKKKLTYTYTPQKG
jgi:hypothetical protein